MKHLIFSILLICGLATTALAGGITGSVTDGRGKGKSGVTITVKVSGQSTSVSTGKDGSYTVELPSSSYGRKAKVYSGGTYVTSCTIPSSGDYAIVNVKFK